MKLVDPESDRPQLPFVPGEDGRLAKDVTPTYTRRLSTGVPDLDRVFGSTTRYDEAGNITAVDWGMAVGKAYLLYGQGGTGKTTLYTLLLIKLIEECDLRVGVGMMEMSAAEYMEFVENMYKVLKISPDRLYTNLVLFEGTDHVKHCARLKELHLDWMIWDSYSMFDGSGSERGAKRIIRDIKSAVEGRCCAMVVGHLDEEGKIRGHKKVVDMCDGQFMLERCPYLPHEQEDGFTSRMTFRSGKNRGGASNETAYVFRRGEELLVWNGYQRTPEPISH